MFNDQSLFEGHIGGLLFIHSLSSDTKLPHRAGLTLTAAIRTQSLQNATELPEIHTFLYVGGWNIGDIVELHTICTSTGNPGSCSVYFHNVPF